MSRDTVDQAAVQDLIKRTCTDRGLPEKVTDPAALRKVAGIVRAGGAA